MTSKKHQNQTLNERISELLVDRKILHFRYDAHLRQQVLKKLTRNQRELINRLESAGIQALPKRQLDKLLVELKEKIAEVYRETATYTKTELSGFFNTEVSNAHHLYNDAVNYDLFNAVPSYRTEAINKTMLIAGAPLEDWWNKQRADLAFKFEATVRQGLIDGTETGKIITDIKDLMQTSRRWAETLVITAVASVADKAHEALKNENMDLINGEMHLSTLDTRTSEVCRLRDGLKWDTEKEPVGHNVPYQRPPLHPRCRSLLQLWLKSFKELGLADSDLPSSTRASMDGQVPDHFTYEDWLKTKSESTQDSILGKGKADLWRRGVITFRDMLDQSGRPLTLEQLQEYINMPETVRKIMRKTSSTSFKDKAMNAYYDFLESGIKLDHHAAMRIAGRFEHYDELKEMILTTEPNYLEGDYKTVRYFSEKGIAIIQSKIDNMIVTIVEGRKRPKKEWVKIND